MTERPNEVAGLARFAREQWPIVLTAVIIGGLIAGLWAYFSAPDPGFVGRQRVRVAVGVVNIPDVPNVDSIISAVSLPEVKRSAAESLGISPSALGPVTAAVDGKNTSVVVVASHRPDKEMAGKIANVVAEAARAKALSQIDPNIDYLRETIAEQTSRIAALNTRLESVQVETKAPGLTPAELASFEQAVTNIQAQIYSAQDKADLAALQLRQAERYAYLDGGPVVVQGNSGGYLLSSVLRGMLVGLLAGLAVAWLRFRRGARVARS